ncbi:MAG: hypothetical protein ACI8QD_000217 [Cyclobacteriaceae bacterium]
MLRSIVFFVLAITTLSVAAQRSVKIAGSVVDMSDNPLIGATIQSYTIQKVTTTNKIGAFQLKGILSDSIELQVRYLGFITMDTTIAVNEASFKLRLKEDVSRLDEISVTESSGQLNIKESPNMTAIAVESIRSMPSANADFNQILKTLPGVSSGNELSSGYQVRGGNFDENLVYVNDIPIYRPFLANTGRQEGLSFVNPLLVSDVSFYAGGWEAKYGDKMSSSLNIKYTEPDEKEGMAHFSLLGAEAYFGNSSKSKRIKYLIGARHRDTRYLLNSLEVEGAYFPKFTDVQSLITFDLTSKDNPQRNKTKLNWLNAYSRNRYLTTPESQVTEFGSVVRNLRIQTAFEGRELLNYDTYQTGFNLSHIFSQRFASQMIGTFIRTVEEENFEVEGAYRLCDVDNNPSSGSFDECIITRGVGSQYDFGRNQLNASILSLENRNTWLIDDRQSIEWGIGFQQTIINDSISEYSFQDSADFVTFNEVVFNDLALDYFNMTGYGQYTRYSRDSTHRVHGGVRLNYWSQNRTLLVSPRLSYTFRTSWSKRTDFTLSWGVYQQPPFYRELRNFDGQIDASVDAQRSTHLIMGMNRYFEMWSRPFVLTSQIYYKWLDGLIPYDIDNMRLRYYTDQEAIGYATGVDVRLNGEFIPGTQSWFSASILSTKENILNDGLGYFRRPTDQRLQLGVYFEDHMPGDPSLSVFLNMQFGSGFPFGPPEQPSLRNRFQGDEYYRADIGLSKSFSLNSSWIKDSWIRLEVLNVLGADNTLSYTWIQDVSGTSFAIPNSLSARLLNIKLGFEIN